MNQIRALAACLLTAALCLSAWSQEPQPEDVEPLERYQVEILAFAYADGPSAAGELLRRPPSLPPEPEPTTDGEPPNAGAPGAEPAEPIMQPEPEPEPEPAIADEEVPEVIVRFVTLLQEELELVDAFQRLDELSAYEILLHGGWSQEGVAEEFALPLDIRILGIGQSATSPARQPIKFAHPNSGILDHR